MLFVHSRLNQVYVRGQVDKVAEMAASDPQSDCQALALDTVKTNGLDNVECNKTDRTKADPAEDKKAERKRVEAIRHTKELTRLVRNDEVDKMERFVRMHRPQLDVRDLGDPLQSPLLLIACQRTNLKMAHLLLSNASHPADVNAADVEGLRPLWYVI